MAQSGLQHHLRPANIALQVIQIRRSLNCCGCESASPQPASLCAHVCATTAYDVVVTPFGHRFRSDVGLLTRHEFTQLRYTSKVVRTVGKRGRDSTEGIRNEIGRLAVRDTPTTISPDDSVTVRGSF